MWFDPGALSKNKTKPLATSATSATFEEKIPKTETQSRKVAKVAEGAEQKIMIIICYTPNGNAIGVKATSPEHAEFLQRMNPSQRTREI